MTPPGFSVVVLNWNGREDTLRCLASIPDEAPTYVPDNGSVDGSVEAVRERFPHVTVIENGANLGYSAGNNRGIERALAEGAQWVVLLNNDAVLEPGALDELAAASSRWPGAGILAGKVLFDGPGDRVWWAGQRVALLTGYSGRPRGHGRADGPRYCVEGPVDRAVGAFMAASRRAIEAAGMLDEELFAYVEDVEWSLRARAAGFEVVFVPAARARHRVSASTGGAAASTHTVYYGVRNTLRVVERHRPLGAIGTWLRRAAVLVAFGGHAAVVLRRRAALVAVAEGWRDFRAGRYRERDSATVRS